MVVLLDVEWVEDDNQKKQLTQLSALRVASDWSQVDTLHAIAKIHTSKKEINWRHVAYNGHTMEEFQQAKPAKDCLRQFLEWLQPDDKILCWHKDSVTAIVQMCAFDPNETKLRYFSCLNKRLYKMARKEGKTERSLYTLACAYGIQVPKPEHKSCNDVEVMRQLVLKMKIEQKDLYFRWPEMKKREVPLSERNKAIIESCQYEYLYAPKAEVFHSCSCKQMLRAKQIMGCVYYKTAAKHRRPCKLCKPKEPETRISENPMPSTPPIRLIVQNFPRVPPRGVTIRTKLLTGEVCYLEWAALVGYCCCHLHPGKITERIMKEHRCDHKNCHYFRKYEDSDYWRRVREGEQQKKEQLRLREQAKNQKKRIAAEIANMEKLQSLFQSYVDEIGYDMKILQVKKEKEGVFLVFYVSAAPYNDYKEFSEFLETIRFMYPGYRLLLRHIKDEYGRFVTTDEYRKRGKS